MIPVYYCFSVLLLYVKVIEVQLQVNVFVLLSVQLNLVALMILMLTVLNLPYPQNLECFRLTIEETDEEGMHYQSAMSDILDGDKVIVSCRPGAHFSLANLCGVSPEQ